VNKINPPGFGNLCTAMKYCPHCQYEVSDRVFRDHRLNFKNKVTGKWTLPKVYNEYEEYQASVVAATLEIR